MCLLWEEKCSWSSDLSNLTLYQKTLTYKVFGNLCVCCFWNSYMLCIARKRIIDRWYMVAECKHSRCRGEGGLYEQNNPRSCCWMIIIIVRITWFVNMNTVASDIVLYQWSYHDTDVQSVNQRPYLVLVRWPCPLHKSWGTPYKSPPQIYKFLPFQVHFEAMSINPSPTGAFCLKIVVINALLANFIKSQQKTILT